MTSVAGGFRERIVGRDLLMPVLGGRRVPYVNLDNAASHPAAPRRWWTRSRSSCPTTRAYTAAAATSRGSRTAAYDEAHRTVARFVGADPDTAAVVFGKNTTEAINKLARIATRCRRTRWC